jgi:4-hydroxy-2-oxoheptanedioate aldolase
LVFFRKNKLRELMRKGEPTIGTHTHSPWPGMIEIIGRTGAIDYVEFLATYAPYDLSGLDDMARAADLFGMSTMIKIDPEPRRYLVQRAIGSGFQSVLFANLTSVQEVEESIRVVRAEPKGTNGCNMHRIEGYFLACGTEEFAKYCDDVVVNILVEKKSLYDQLENIANLEGVDMLQFGECDFAMSLGHPGQTTHPKVLEAEQNTIKTALKYDKHPLVEVNHPEEAEKYVKMGVDDFNIGWDVTIIHDFLSKNGSSLRKMVQGGK